MLMRGCIIVVCFCFSFVVVFFTQADLLDVVGVLYIGGLPQNYTTKRIGPVKDTESYKSYHTP